MEYIDLGLSVKWATCNVGATKPEEYGDYFAWGEVVPKNIYLKETYLPDKNFNKIFKLPTKMEFRELQNHCTWTWTTLNGVEGYNVEGPSGNSIFLPAAGCYRGSIMHFAQHRGNYWSSTRYGLDYALDITFNPWGVFMYASNHSDGQSIRLVENIFF